MRPIAVLRPEPGNSATADRIRALGGTAIRLPLFAVRPLAWTPPEPRAHDALILTSANAVRWAGPGLDAIRALPVLAVGAATAEAAKAAGLNVMAVGDGDAATLGRHALRHDVTKALHLAGRDRTDRTLPSVARTIEVYESVAITPDARELTRLDGAVALVHSPRAGRHLAGLLAERATTLIAAISESAQMAAGAGWQLAAATSVPTDEALIALAIELANRRFD